MPKLIIKRSQWLRGEGNIASKLRRSTDGKMCCLGFLASQIGLTEEEITNLSAPASIPNAAWPTGFIGRDYSNDECLPLMILNDSKSIAESDRERELQESFKKFDIDVEFVD